MAQGRDAAKQFMLDNPEVAKEIEEKIKLKLASGKLIKVETAVGEDWYKIILSYLINIFKYLLLPNNHYVNNILE